jgi:hypothetical protein
VTEDELKAILDNGIRQAHSYSSEIAEQRAEAIAYYRGDPDAGPLEVIEGRSSVVSTDVRDTVEWLLPSLLRVFTAGEKACQFEPRGEEDIEAAEQETDLVNHVVTQENDAFMVFYSWFKDALLEKNGVVKVCWEESEHIEKERYEGLSDEEYRLLIGQDGVEVIEHSERPDSYSQPGNAPAMPQGQPAPMLHDVTIQVSRNYEGVKLYNVPPEEFLISPRSRDVVSAPLVGHRTRLTVTKLLEMGFKESDVRSIPTDHELAYDNERSERFEDEGGGENSALDDSMREVEVFELYPYVDWDGDGRAELRKITYAGGVILENEEADLRPFPSITPNPMPHRWVGMSVADMVAEIQVIKTVLTRGALDNLYLTNAPMTEVAEEAEREDGTTIEDLLTRRPGALVRSKQFGNIREIPTQGVVPAVFSMLEYMNTEKENRSGVTRYNQGLDANSLNKTATGIAAIQNAAMQRMELIARIFAETGVRDLFRMTHEVLRKHATKSKIIRLRNKWVPVDPRQWKTRTDMTITVGLGTGNKDQMLMHLEGVFAKQMAIAQAPPFSHLVTADNIYNTAAKIIENAGLKSAPLYFKEPQDGEQPPPPAPNPKMMEVQANIQAKQAEMQAGQQMQAQKMQGDQQLQAQKMQMEAALAEQRLAAEMKIKEMELQANIALKREEMVLKHEIAKAEAAARAMQPPATVEQPR